MTKKLSRASVLVKLKKGRTIPPVKCKNIENRSREYLTASEVKLLVDAAKDVGRHGARDALLILMTCRHALRVGEVVDLKGVDTRAIQAHLGHKNIQHTVLYTKLDPARFKGSIKPIDQMRSITRS